MTPEGFLEAFIEGWTRSQPDDWIAYFEPLSHPDVVATQPVLPAATGIAAYMDSFRSTFALLKNVRVAVQRSACTADAVFIESVLTATIGGRPVRLEVTDRFVLRDGLIYRRQAFFDPTPIVVGVLLRPWVMPTVIRGLRKRS